MPPNLYQCETCTDVTCWLCKGNAYYDKAVTSKFSSEKEHKHEIAKFRDFVKYRGCVSHSDFHNELDRCKLGCCEFCNKEGCWYIAAIRKREREKLLDGRKLYRCKSDTCSDNGGVCILCIPDMDFKPPTSCVNPESFTDNGDEPDCEWEELQQEGGGG